MNQQEQLFILEALLFASPEPLTQSRVNFVFDSDAPLLSELIPLLQEKFKKEERPIEILAVAGGFQLTTQKVYETWIRRLLNKTGKLTLSQAAMETLAIIAYKQPVNRFEIEAVRGVDCSGVLKTILDRNLIKIKGRDDGPGRPLLYSTTERFLEYFGLNRVADMPKMKEITELTNGESDTQLNAFVQDNQHSPSETEQSSDIPPV